MTTVADGTYLDRLLAHVGTADTCDVLADSGARVEAVVKRLGASALRRPYGPGKWTGAQVLAHLADAELVTGYRARRILTEDRHLIQEYDETRWVGLYADVDAEAALAAFLGARRLNLCLFRTLDRAALERAGIHPRRGEEKLGVTLRALAGHTLSHLGQIESLA